MRKKLKIKQLMLLKLKLVSQEEMMFYPTARKGTR